MLRRLVLLFVCVSLLLLSVGICSAGQVEEQKFEISESQLNELWTIAEQWEQLNKELLTLAENSGTSSNELLMKLINSQKIITAQQSSVEKSLKFNELTLKQLNIAQSSLDELNKSFKMYEQKAQSIIKAQDKEIRGLKVQRLGLITLLAADLLLKKR